MTNKKILILILIVSFLFVSCSEITPIVEEKTNTIPIEAETKKEIENLEIDTSPFLELDEELFSIEVFINDRVNNGYKVFEVEGGNQSGFREPFAIVDIGFGKREHWAFTNANGQLTEVYAKDIVLQNDDTEPVTSKGRYYWDEAKVPGTEHSELDEGHVIADSLGGVSNAYNITPQNSTLNQHGEQAYMEKTIRQAGGAKNFVAIISYPNDKTQIPNHYYYQYEIDNEKIVVEFENVNPEEDNEKLGVYNTNLPTELNEVDTNNNGRVTISEAKKAGFKMPINSDHWLYEYMTDSDGDGLVGE